MPHLESDPRCLEQAQRVTPSGNWYYGGRLKTHPDQQAHLDFEDFRRALAKLPAIYREALVLVGAEGLPYEEAAAICGVPVGTIKSRVNRGREQLSRLLAGADADGIGPDQITRAAMQSY